ncbi:MAG: flagellar basal-body rod protein FlgF [Thermodesulfobacteriota bacterium]
MVSGKYSALAGAVSREQAMAHTSANMANINTVGYKKSMVSFESILRGERQSTLARGINYNRIKNNYTDFSAGPQRQTGNQLDFAIHGDGFFKVQGPEGILYTRRGDFHIDEEGTLRTGNGFEVLDDGNSPIQIAGTGRARISSNTLGEISVINEQGQRSVQGRLALVQISDPKLLKRETDTTFSLGQNGSEEDVEEPRLEVGSLELANINMAEEMTHMINNLRTFETYHKVLKSYSTIGQKQDELGTLG